MLGLRNTNRLDTADATTYATAAGMTTAATPRTFLETTMSESSRHDKDSILTDRKAHENVLGEHRNAIHNGEEN